ncbi:MAG: hypothetical protein H7338_11480 [Candidatus Sericytochromatia bacterium]|nr:hypothetical protein [Candidatus Sericytochromatia bacterium]
MQPGQILHVLDLGYERSGPGPEAKKLPAFAIHAIENGQQIERHDAALMLPIG